MKLTRSPPDCTRELLNPMAEVSSPAFGQGWDLYGTVQQVPIVPVVRIQPGDVGNRDTVRVALDQLNGVPGFNRPFAHDGDVETSPTTGEEALDDVLPSELYAEFVARQAGFGDHHFRRTHPKPITNVESVLPYPLGGEGFAEHSPGQLPLGQFPSPMLIVVHQIHVRGFTWPSVD